MAIFQKSVIKKHLNNLDKEQVEKAYLKFKSNYNPAKIEQIKTLKEEEYQDGFLRDIFVDVFGYILRPDENYNLQREFKNQTDGKKADGAILKNGKAIAVIELKSTKTKDLTKVTQQAFNYKNNQPECKYVITSNFQKLRFYIDYANEYEEFDLFYLEKEDFELLYLLLNKNNIFDNIPLKLKEETKFHEQEVSSKLYKDYSHFKRKLYENLTKNHPESDKLILFKKSQKLLDRFLFILFSEDSGLLPPNSISRVIDTYHKLIELDAKKPLYDIFKQYFEYMNIGRKGKTSAGDIPAYNGGLFYTDDLLDNLKIDNNILIDDLRNLSKYDFNTEVDVNILGHIFEHSLSEIEEITAEIEATMVATKDLSPLKKISKRKKDGVFYTPKYITQYIVENTVGILCNEKRIALEIEEIEFDGTFRTKTGKLSEKGKKLYNRLKKYKDWLISLKIIDPACGSGAFLNQALSFLIEEHKVIDDIIAELTNSPIRLFDVDKSILENNLFGVDINEESVEIAQLSLWLRTAQKGRKLSNLNNNIKCGNSLIDDPEIAGDKAFNWQTEFPQVFKEKDKKIYHITTAIHDSRTSARMEKYKVRERRELGTNPYPNIIYFTKEDDLLITKTIAQIIKEDKLNMLSYNICADHLHLLLACDIDEVPNIMQKIKSVTSKVVGGLHITREHAPLQNKKKPLWQQKYSPPKEVTSQDQLYNTINYIQKNRSKHELPQHSKEIKLLIENMCIDFDTAMKPEYFGGFDCVIGNPPYGAELPSQHVEFYRNHYKTVIGHSEIYYLFIEKAIKNLTSKNGLIGYIIPNAWLSNKYASKVRELLINETEINYLINFNRKIIFKDANVETSIFIIKNKTPNKINETFVGQDLDSTYSYNQSEWRNNQNFLMSFAPNCEVNEIIQKVNSSKFKLSEKLDISNGIKPYQAGYGINLDGTPLTSENVKAKIYHSNIEENQLFKKELKGKGVHRYSLKWDVGFIQWGKWLMSPKSEHYFEQPKILIRQIISDYFFAVLDCQKYYADQSLYICTNFPNKKENLSFYLALLNSKLYGFYFRKFYSEEDDLFPKIKVNELKNLPIKEITKEAQQPFTQKADIMLELNKELQEKSTRFIKRVTDNFEIEKISKKLSTFYNYDFKTFVTELKKKKVVLSLKQQDEWQDYFDSYKTEINQLQNEIQETDKEIDQMVYELYGLSDEEIDIVEKS